MTTPFVTIFREILQSHGKIATAAKVEIDSLAQRIRDEVLAEDAVVVAPLLIGAWARHPG